MKNCWFVFFKATSKFCPSRPTFLKDKHFIQKDQGYVSHTNAFCNIFTLTYLGYSEMGYTQVTVSWDVTKTNL